MVTQRVNQQSLRLEEEEQKQGSGNVGILNEFQQNSEITQNINIVSNF